MDRELMDIANSIDTVVPYVATERAKMLDADGELRWEISPKDAPDLENAILGAARQTLRQAEDAVNSYIASQEERIAKTETSAESSLRGENLQRLGALSTLYEQDARRDVAQFVRQMKAAALSNDRVEQLAYLRAARAILPRRGNRADAAVAPQYAELQDLTAKLADLVMPEWQKRERDEAQQAIADARTVLAKAGRPIVYLNHSLPIQRGLEERQRQEYRQRMAAQGLDPRTGGPVGAGRRR